VDGPGVDADLGGGNQRQFKFGVAEDHPLAEVVISGNETVPRLAEGSRLLFGQGAMWFQAGMNEDVRLGFPVETQVFEKGQMGIRQEVPLELLA
jgi:hypothetical protein